MLRAPSRRTSGVCVMGLSRGSHPGGLVAKTWLALVAQFRATSLPFSHPGVNSSVSSLSFAPLLDDERLVFCFGRHALEALAARLPRCLAAGQNVRASLSRSVDSSRSGGGVFRACAMSSKCCLGRVGFASSEIGQEREIRTPDLSR